MGATIMPATAPMAAARPQPRPSIQLTRMPTSLAESGFWAAARIARPTEVYLKNANKANSTTSTTPAEPIWCDEKYLVSNQASFGKGLAKDLIVWSKSMPDTALKISSKPMNTMTLVSAGAFSIGRSTMRCTSRPPMKDTAMVTEERCPVGPAQFVDQRPGNEGAEGGHFALGEIDVVGGLVDHHQGEGDRAVDDAVGEARRDLIEESFHDGP